MAQKVQVLLTDDLDGSTASDTVAFAVDGKAFEIDLSAENSEKLRVGLAPFIAAARRKSGQINGARRPRRAAETTSDTAGAIRTWAKENGYVLSERGRVPSTVREAFEKAHNKAE